MYRLKTTISFDGTNYYGFQVQGDNPTIELALEKALKRITNEEIKVFGCSRTDRFVHAVNMVIHFDTTKNILPNKWKVALNTYLPEDIRVREVLLVEENFHARFSAIKKEYRYYILHNEENVFYRNYMAHYKNLDINLMNDAIKLFIGTHDFRGFSSASNVKKTDFVRTIYEAYIKQDKNILEFIFVGTGFLKYQVRRMMGLLIDIGLKKKDKSLILEVLDKKDARLSHSVANGNGLYLYKVTYEEDNI